MQQGDSKTRPFAVYVAATSAGDQAQRVRAAMAVLDAYGIRVTSSWVQTIAKVGSANPPDASAMDRRGWSVTCLNEIDDADAVWFLVPPPPLTTRGGWCESGYAYASGKHVLFSGETVQSIFCALGSEFVSDEAAVQKLLELREAHVSARVEEGLRELAEAEAMDMRLKSALTGDV